MPHFERLVGREKESNFIDSVWQFGLYVEQGSYLQLCSKL